MMTDGIMKNQLKNIYKNGQMTGYNLFLELTLLAILGLVLYSRHAGLILSMLLLVVLQSQVCIKDLNIIWKKDLYTGLKVKNGNIKHYFIWIYN